MLTRVEVDVRTGERVVINQYAYRKGEDVLVLDDGEAPPVGYERFIPGEEPGPE